MEIPLNIFFLAGLGLFLYGITLSRRAVGLLAGERLRLLLAKPPKRNIRTVAANALAAMSLQSSRTAILIAVDFAESQLVPLTRAFTVVLSADIGTALMIMLLSFKNLAHLSPYLIIAGIVAENLLKDQRQKRIGKAIVGYGFTLLAMELLYLSSAALADSTILGMIASFMSTHTVWLFIIAALFTITFRLTALTIVMAMVLATANLVTLNETIPIILGANLGSAISTAFSSLKKGVAGRQVSLCHICIKIFGAVIFMFIGPQLCSTIEGVVLFGPYMPFIPVLSTATQIALFHFLYNVALAAIFLPIIGPTVKAAARVVPASKVDREKFGPKYLSGEALESPVIAIAVAKQEVQRIAKMTQEMFQDVLDAFRMNINFDTLKTEVANTDDRIDILEKSVRFFLAKISHGNLNNEQAADEIALLSIAGELESIGDTIQRRLIGLAHKKRKKLVRFSADGWGELKKLHKLVAENFDLTLAMLARPDREISLKMMRHEHKLKELEQELKQSHLMRLHKGLPESFDTSTIHLEILGAFRAINYKLSEIVEAAAELA